MGIHRVDDIIIYTNSDGLDEMCCGGNVEKEIAEWIVDHYEYNIILDILNKNYEGLAGEEKSLIIGNIVNRLSDGRNVREKKIENCLKNYLKTENEINLQGFVRFRLKDYRAELEKIADEAVDEYIVEKEYFDFIGLLRQFVELNAPLAICVNVYITEDFMRFEDSDGHDLSCYINETMYPDDDMTDEDKLLTILIMLAPRRIRIYMDEEYAGKEIIRTIKMIFRERTTFFIKNVDFF